MNIVWTWLQSQTTLNSSPEPSLSPDALTGFGPNADEEDDDDEKGEQDDGEGGADGADGDGGGNKQ